MATCEICGNDYDKAFQVLKDGEAHTFDSFECAITALAPRCAACDVRIVGTAWRRTACCSAATIAPARRA